MATSIEREISLRVSADILHQLCIAGRSNHYIVALEVGPESTVFVADGAVAFGEGLGFGGQLNANATAVADCSQGVIFVLETVLWLGCSVAMSIAGFERVV